MDLATTKNFKTEKKDYDNRVIFRDYNVHLS